MHILIINGPNLNMLGIREPDIYGAMTLDEIREQCALNAEALGLTIDFRQSNHEGEIVEWIQAALEKADAIIINAAAYTHTSVAIHDALKLFGKPIAEVHLSDPKAREDFRHFSYVESVAQVHISGQGPDGYTQALQELHRILSS